MGITIEKAGAATIVSRAEVEDPKARLRAELAALREKREAEQTDPELRELEEDLAFEKACAAAKPGERIGRARLEPGQIIFRQLSKSMFRRIIDAAKVPPGKSPMTDAQAAEAQRIVSEQVARECLISPSWETFDGWLVEYPLAMGAYRDALDEHNDAHRRDHAAK